jgi:aconitate hydratase
MSSSYIRTLEIGTETYHYCDIARFAGTQIEQMPYSLRILLENLLRHDHNGLIPEEVFSAVIDRTGSVHRPSEIPFYPGRVLMQDFTGVPAVVDLAALRDAIKEAGKDPRIINPQVPVDLIIDHSVQIDSYGSSESRSINVALEYQRNHERYTLLKWAQESFDNLRIVPPNSGICHQVNLEYLSECVRSDQGMLFPDSLVGTDSHTTMINGLGVMGWGVGGIEAEAVMLGQPYFMPIPRVVGVKLSGSMDPACTATDLVLTLTHLLRNVGVVGAFVEFFGPGLVSLDLPDRATIANMSPEYGATMGFFPVDERTIEYLHLTDRARYAERTEAYCRANALFHDSTRQALYDEVLSVDLESIQPSIAGPSRPQDLIILKEAPKKIAETVPLENDRSVSIDLDGRPVALPDGAIAIAAITSCTNTSNPAVMIAAGLVAQKAVARSLHTAPWVKTSLAPGSQVVSDYLEKSQLLSSLETLGFSIAAFGCTTCIGNSGPLHPAIETAQLEHDLTLAAVLSGNRNFEGRIHQRVGASFLMSPPLVVAYALAGRIDFDIMHDPLGLDAAGEPVYLHDIWPTPEEVTSLVRSSVTQASYQEKYSAIFSGDTQWAQLESPRGDTFAWDPHSTYIARVPFFEQFPAEPLHVQSISKARALLALGDSVTTDHISPAGSIHPDYPAGRYLKAAGISQEDFNSYGSRRGNHEVMMRGTFANIRIRQKLTAPKVGGFTKKLPEETIMYVYDAAMAYREEGTDLIILAGKEYGTGSSRDWAAKGTYLLGVRAVLAQSFERIHRSNLVGMGVLPLVFETEDSEQAYHLDGTEQFTLEIPDTIAPNMAMTVVAERSEGTIVQIPVICRLDSPAEVTCYQQGGILQSVLRSLLHR